MPRIIKYRIEKTSRLDIRKEVLYHPILDRGIGLPCLQLKLFSMKIIDFFASDMSDQNSFLPTDSILPSDFTNLSSSDFPIFSNSTNSRLIIPIQTKSRDVYYFCLQNCSFHRAAISRLGFAANRYLCSEEELIKFTGKVWKNSMLDVWEKTFFINLHTLFSKIEKSGGFYFSRMPPNVSIVI